MTHMEDVLDLYTEPYDPQRPVVCFDETSTQMLSNTRPPLLAEPAQPMREDYEYRREGTRNLFLACEPLAGWRHVAVTARRTTQEFAHQMRWLVDEVYRDVPVVRVVLDNLNTHRKASLYRAFPAVEARRIARKLEFHYTPKHGSWLNPVLSLPKGWRKSSSAFLSQLPQAASPGRGIPLPGGPRPGTGTKRSSSPHQLALQHPGR